MKYLIDAVCKFRPGIKRVKTDSIEELKKQFENEGIIALEIRSAQIRTEAELIAFTEFLYTLTIVK